jgi:hypothetical protein
MISFMSLSLIKLTMAQTYFINAWRSEDCVGPPQIFMRVELRDTRNQSDIATYYYERVGADHCGQSAVPYVNPKRCCTTITKNGIDMAPYQSASVSTAVNDLGDNVPHTANGKKYCQIMSNISNTGSLSQIAFGNLGRSKLLGLKLRNWRSH